jgi:hypothetical protein
MPNGSDGREALVGRKEGTGGIVSVQRPARQNIVDLRVLCNGRSLSGRRMAATTTTMPKAFISSTSRDLEDYRRAASEECVRVGLLPIAMEFFEAMARGATEGSKQKLDHADVYVGIFARRYGYIEDGYDTSVTECEFDYAGQRSLDRLCFLIEPNCMIGGPSEDELHRNKLEAFKRKIEKHVIPSRFRSVDDFRGKLRLSLLEWKEGDAKGRLPQPTLASNLLEPNEANRLTYRARKNPFAGRRQELAALERFLADGAAFSWLVVAGPAGAGKSRLAQKFCLDVAPKWRAGFLPKGLDFDWAVWKPNVDTLIVVDYAAERVGELRTVLDGFLAGGARAERVRLLLLEREPDGAWMEGLLGGRSAGYAIEQARFAESPLVVGPMSGDELWQLMLGVLRPKLSRLPPKQKVLDRLHDIDPTGRPLYASFAADALASGRDLREWDRDRLLRQVLKRNREIWKSKGAGAEYENLLALATAVGGDTEKILETPAAAPKLPAVREFDRGLYNTMTGCELSGEDVPALKPDLLGEFFVLEFVRGRNDRITAAQAAEMAAAAWRIRGGTQSTFSVAGVISFVSASSLILFLTRLVEDFPDHPATRHLLCRPKIVGADLSYWATLISIGIRRFAVAGNIDAGQALFSELGGMTPEELRTSDCASGFVRAGLYLLPVFAKAGRRSEAREFLDRVRAFAAESERRDFCEAAAEAVALLLAHHERDLAEELIRHEGELVRSDPVDDSLRLPYARALAAVVTSDEELGWREQVYDRLHAYCKAMQGDVSLYEPLARAEQALCKEFVKSDRLAEATTKNNQIRGLERLRSERRMFRYKPPPSFMEIEWIEDDLREIRIQLADSDTELIGPMVKAERFRDADMLLNEVERLARHYPGDVEFARKWAIGVMMHADSVAAQGLIGQVIKAVEALLDLARRFDGDPDFVLKASTLLRVAAARAFVQDMEGAGALFDKLEQLARQDDPPSGTVADYALLALHVSQHLADQKRYDEMRSTAKRAAWAIRSDALRIRLREKGDSEERIAELEGWLEAIVSDSTSAASRETPGAE